MMHLIIEIALSKAKSRNDRDWGYKQERQEGWGGDLLARERDREKILVAMSSSQLASFL